MLHPITQYDTLAAVLARLNELATSPHVPGRPQALRTAVHGLKRWPTATPFRGCAHRQALATWRAAGGVPGQPSLYHRWRSSSSSPARARGPRLRHKSSSSTSPSSPARLDSSRMSPIAHSRALVSRARTMMLG